ncbi:sugar phosphate isomerase/epimerase family protein [Streptomonospora algeriensis]|uniref:Sugar phosphate isomerase/epimerase family protein n=1 Tax=Streptomonospora algeriensis TaxID=995084 RepID=A0ABW3BFG0_9ACTN
MRLGLLTACFPELSLEEVAEWAADNGYASLEAAAWPAGSDHPHDAAHLDAEFPQQEAERVQELLDRLGLTVSAVVYCENNLHADTEERDRIHRHLRACVETAAALGVSYVSTFVGRDVTRSVADNLRLAERLLPPLVDYAGERGVRLLAENCPMEGSHPDGYPGNLAYSPELWEWMSDLGLLLDFDPSHLPWLGIDAEDALEFALERGLVAHAQAKDVEVDTRLRTRYGVFGRTVGRASPVDAGWWSYRVPGRGRLDWNRIVDILHKARYTGTLAVEHEDPVWGGTAEHTKQGLRIAARTLLPLVSPGDPAPQRR